MLQLFILWNEVSKGLWTRRPQRPHHVKLCVRAIFQHSFYMRLFSLLFSYSKGQQIATPFYILKIGLLLSSLALGESNWSLWSVEAVSYSEYTVFLSPFATSFPIYKTLPGFSAAVIWEKSQLSHDGGRNCYFRVSDRSFGTFPEKERVQ